MKTHAMLLCAATLLAFQGAGAYAGFEKDTIATTAGDLVITFIGHGTLMMQVGGKTIHIDPVSQYADYDALPKADLILITHHHGDHCDAAAIEKTHTAATTTILTAACAQNITGGIVLANNALRAVGALNVTAVPAYNLKHGPAEGKVFHPKGEGNGYILTVGKTRVYVAGDTENTPEMKALKNIDVAFLPMNLPYTMTPEMVADAARAFRPKILYPYHYGRTNVNSLLELLKKDRAIEVRVRQLQ